MVKDQIKEIMVESFDDNFQQCPMVLAPSQCADCTAQYYIFKDKQKDFVKAAPWFGLVQVKNVF